MAVANEIYGLIPIITNPGPNSILAPTPEKAQMMPPKNPKINIKIMSLFDPWKSPAANWYFDFTFKIYSVFTNIIPIKRKIMQAN